MPRVDVPPAAHDGQVKTCWSVAGRPPCSVAPTWRSPVIRRASWASPQPTGSPDQLRGGPRVLAPRGEERRAELGAGLFVAVHMGREPDMPAEDQACGHLRGVHLADRAVGDQVPIGESRMSRRRIRVMSHIRRR